MGEHITQMASDLREDFICAAWLLPGATTWELGGRIRHRRMTLLVFGAYPNVSWEKGCRRMCSVTSRLPEASSAPPPSTCTGVRGSAHSQSHGAALKLL